MERKMSSSRRHLLLLLSLAPALLLYLFALRSTQPFLHLSLAADGVQPPRSAVDSAATRVVGEGGHDLVLVQGGGVSNGKEQAASGWNATASQAPLMEKVEVERTSWSASFSVQEAAMEDAARGAVQPPCDVNDGRWVWDESYPLYDGSSCPFIDDGFSCQANGRADQSYTKWRWQPTHCIVPRFDARKTLEMLRGKRLALVGDSIGRNQWESIMCLLRGVVSDPTRIRQAGGHKFTKKRGHYNFRFLDYNCSVEYHMAHFLVSEGNKRGNGTETLRIDTIARSSPKWIGADVLVFNTGHWWSHRKAKAGVNYYQEGDVVHPYLEANMAYRRALTTWASWIDNHIDPLRTQVFFRTSAPTHYRGGEWNSGGHCRESTMPIDGVARARRQLPVPEKNAILEQVVKHMKTPVTIMDIVFLSRLRVDGHPSVYGRKGKKMGGVELSVQDCSHWCLPGVPDTWNELLFYHLAAPSQKH